MLPKVRRLKRSDFPLFLKGFRTFNSLYFFVKVRKNTVNLSRFTAVVPVSVSKKANIRNKIKRRMRYIVEKNLGSLRESQLIAIYAKKNSLGVKYGDLEEDLIKLFKKANILKC